MTEKTRNTILCWYSVSSVIISYIFLPLKLGVEEGLDSGTGKLEYQLDEDYEGELTFQEEILNAVMTYAPYVIGAVLVIVVIVVLIKIISRNRKPKYTGKH